MIDILLAASLLTAQSSDAAAAPEFTDAELELAEFWEEMGPTLRDEGIDAYVARYHPDFTHWDIENTGGLSDRASAAAYWTGFAEAGHVISCTFVDPVTLTIVDGVGFGRLYYEQTNHYADGRVETSAYRMSLVLLRVTAGWQVRETNMVRIGGSGADDAPFAFRHCSE
ncbi:hypothetical protein [Hyphobacterium sp.]|uniref:hypothetical protein n=1 Tax=Hyphobacterium sp. TaxID=2004662 RepID=UPI003B5248C7